VTDPLGRETEVLYDNAERPLRVTDAAGNLVEYAYDANGNPTEIEATDLNPDGSTVTVTTTHRYDALDRRVASADALGNETRWFYDARGNVTGTLDPEVGDEVWVEASGSPRPRSWRCGGPHVPPHPLPSTLHS